MLQTYNQKHYFQFSYIAAMNYDKDNNKETITNKKDLVRRYIFTSTLTRGFDKILHLLLLFIFMQTNNLFLFL